MKIGIDIHGVLSDLTETIVFIMESLVKNGAEVHVISGSFTEKAKRELDELGLIYKIHYTHVIGVPNILIDIMNIEPINVDGGKYNQPLFKDSDWDRAKSVYAKQYNINLHLDDSMFYLEHFVTPCARLWTKDR